MSDKDLHITVTEAAAALPAARLKREHLNAVQEKIASIEQTTGEKVRHAMPFLHEQDQVRLQQMIDFLESPDLLRLVDEGHVTFGMIKPRTHEAKAGTIATDEEIAQQVHDAVEPPLRVLASQAFLISKEEAGDFYAHLKSRPEIFDRVAGFMASGAVTGLVLYSSNNNAVQQWRQQMGPTNPTKSSEDGTRNTLRHRFADTMENNVVHGSDSIENVKVELAFLAGQLRKML